VIELNDSSHNLKKTIDRDDFVKKTLSDADVPFIVFSAQKSYSIENIKGKIDEALLTSQNTRKCFLQIFNCNHVFLNPRVTETGCIFFFRFHELR
jgi:hypothetical protein